MHNAQIHYEIDTNALTEDLQGYQEDVQRMNELRERSRVTQYESDSSDSDHSTISCYAEDRIKSCMQDRRETGCKICTTKDIEPCVPNVQVHSAAKNLMALGRRIFTASHLQCTRKQVRSTTGIVELLPGWFTVSSSLDSCDAIEKTFFYLKRIFSERKFEQKMECFVAKHPLPNTHHSPVMQNLKGKHYLTTVLLFYGLKNKCALYSSAFCRELLKDLPEKIRVELM